MFGWLRGDGAKKGGSPSKSSGRPPSPTKPEASASAAGAKAKPDPSEGGGFFGLSVQVGDGAVRAADAPAGEEQGVGAGSDSIFSKLSVADGGAAEDGGDDGMFRYAHDPPRRASCPSPRPRGGLAAAAGR